MDQMNGADFPDFGSWWGTLDDYFRKIYDNVNYLYEKKQTSIQFLTRKEYTFIYKSFLLK